MRPQRPKGNAERPRGRHRRIYVHTEQLSFLLTGSETEKAPVPGISENGREMLALYEKLPEREQVLLLGRLQEMTAPLLGETKKRDQAEAASSGGRAG